jgi:UDP-N-acetyl-D-mannosaminuronic acid dehydrogenase
VQHLVCEPGQVPAILVLTRPIAVDFTAASGTKGVDAIPDASETHQSSPASELRMISICMIGLGYIGLPTAAVVASRGMRVFGVDVNPRVVETVNDGRIHIAEPDLDGLIHKVVSDGALTAHTTPQPADIFVIAVPTPLTPDRRPMLDYVFEAGRALAPVLRPGNTVILESTSPVGTTRRLGELLARLRPDLALPGIAPEPDIALAYCPERVLPGRTITELVENDRCVGGMTPACAERAAAFYESFVRGAVLRTAAATAELVKLTENAFRDVNIAFANEMSLVAEHAGVDVWELIRLANRHPRVNILQPGPGVGGHCIAVDPWFIVDAAPAQARLILTAREVNDHKAVHVRGRVAEAAAAMPDAPITCFGLAFKANVDDLRGSPALEIAERLSHDFPGRVAVVEPNITQAPPGLSAPLLSLDEALERPGIFLLLVDHASFRHVPPARLAGRRVIDTRGIWPAG